jgi:hypothetical protein
MVVSAVATLVQLVVLKRPSVRRFLKIPDIDASVGIKQGGMLKVRPLSLQEATKAIKSEKYAGK